jgi:hypothetical protein
MQWTLDHWDEAAPELLCVLERYASGAEQSDEAVSVVFFILHLAGEKQDTRVLAPVPSGTGRGDRHVYNSIRATLHVTKTTVFDTGRLHV